MKLRTTAVTASLLFLSLAAHGEEVSRKPLQGMPISESVEIKPGSSLVFVSGKVPAKKTASGPDRVLETYGNTEEQTVNVLNQIQDGLKTTGLTMNDVVKMQVFLVGGEENKGEMDFAGFMKGYEKFYKDNNISNLPARSAFQVAKLANPAWRVEIEVTAVRPSTK